MRVWKVGLVHRAELGLRVVDVVDVDGLDAQVGAAPVELVGEEARGDAVAVAHDLVGLDDPGLHVGAPARDAAASEPALGRDQHVLARDPDLPRQRAQHRAHVALAALVAIVDRGVHHVEPQLERAPHRGL